MKSLTESLYDEINEKFNLNFNPEECIIDVDGEEFAHIVMPKTAFGQWKDGHIVFVNLLEKSDISKRYGFFKNGQFGFMQKDDAFNELYEYDDKGGRSKRVNGEILELGKILKDRAISIIEVPKLPFVSIAFSNK